MNNNRLRAQNVGQHVLFLHCTGSGAVPRPALRSPSGTMDAPVRDFDSAADTQQAEGGSARQKTTEYRGKTGNFSRKMGDFRGKVGRFSPVGGECLRHLGGNDGGLAAKGKREERKPRNTGQNDTKKSRRLRDVAVFGTKCGGLPPKQTAGASGLRLFVFVGGRCLVDEIEELIELGRDDDFGAAVALTSELGVVGGHGVVLAASGCAQAFGGDAEITL